MDRLFPGNLFHWKIGLISRCVVVPTRILLSNSLKLRLRDFIAAKQQIVGTLPLIARTPIITVDPVRPSKMLLPIGPSAHAPRGSMG